MLSPPIKNIIDGHTPQQIKKTNSDYIVQWKNQLTPISSHTPNSLKKATPQR